MPNRSPAIEEENIKSHDNTTNAHNGLSEHDQQKEAYRAACEYFASIDRDTHDATGVATTVPIDGREWVAGNPNDLAYRYTSLVGFCHWGACSES